MKKVEDLWWTVDGNGRERPVHPPSTIRPQPDDRHIFRPDMPRRGPAIAAMFLSALFFAVMGLFTKMVGMEGAGRPIPASEVTLFRFAFGLLVMLPLQGRGGIQLLGQDRRSLATRGILGGFAVYTYFLSLHYTTLTHAVLLNYTSLIFAPLFAVFVLKEQVTRRAGGAILAAVIGILLITRPEVGALRLGDLFGLLSGLLAGAAITAIRHLRQTETAWSVFFYLCLVGAPVALLACLVQPPVWPTPHAWLLLLGMGVTSVGGQLLITYGFKYVRAAEGGLITVSQVVYNVLAGALWFHEPLTPATLLGGALILGASLWLSMAEQGK